MTHIGLLRASDHRTNHAVTASGLLERGGATLIIHTAPACVLLFFATALCQGILVR